MTWRVSACTKHWRMKETTSSFVENVSLNLLTLSCVHQIWEEVLTCTALYHLLVWALSQYLHSHPISPTGQTQVRSNNIPNLLKPMFIFAPANCDSFWLHFMQNILVMVFHCSISPLINAENTSVIESFYINQTIEGSHKEDHSSSTIHWSCNSILEELSQNISACKHFSWILVFVPLFTKY